MRIAHLLRKYDPNEWGGTESAICRLTAGLAAHGVESTVYAPRLRRARVRSEFNGDWEGEPVPDPLAAEGRTIRRFRACLPIWGISAERRRQLVNLGGNAISFDLPGQLWREPALDVIHTHALGRLGAIGRWVARRRRLPLVVSIHGGAYDLPAGVLEGLVGPAAGGWDWGRGLGLLLGARRLLAQADAIVTVNPREAALVRERHPRQRVLVEAHGVSVAHFAGDHRAEARHAFPVLEGRAVLLVMGRIDPTKNQDWLVAQMGELSRRHPRACLVLLGACPDPAYAAALRDRIVREGLGLWVFLAGSLPFGDPRLIGLLQDARALIVPSLSETFGIVMLEAWAAGTPVISSRTSGAVALIREGIDGWIFDLARPATFHAAVNQVLENPDLRAARGSAGRARVAAEFDADVLAGAMKRLYAELIEDQHALRHRARR